MGNDISPGYAYADTPSGRQVNVDNLNQLAGGATLKETVISARASKESPALSNLLLLSDGALKKVTLEALRALFQPTGFLTADTDGRSKMADGYLTLAKILDGIFTADATGRGKFATGFVTSALMATSAAAGNLASGAIIQGVRASYTASTAISAAIPHDFTIPQSGEGTQILTTSFTPIYSSSVIRIKVTVPFGSTGVALNIGAVFVNSETDATGAAAAQCDASGSNCLNFTAYRTTGVVAGVAMDFKLRVGKGGANNFTVNWALGAASVAFMEIEEIKA